jgi:hypothetical protein
MPSPRLQIVPAAAAGCAAVAAWCSIGSIGVLGDAAGDARIGFLPAFWLLPVFVTAAVGLVWALQVSNRVVRPLFFSLVLVLPWLAISVPVVFLLWTGRPAVAVWIGILVAMVVSATKRWRGALVNPWWGPKIAALVAFVLFPATAQHLSAMLPGGDEPHYLVITQSLLADHDLQIENNHTRGDYSRYFRGSLRPDYLRRGLNGQIYSVHAPGLPAIVLPAFAMGGYRGVVYFLSGIAAIGGAALWLTAFRLGGSVGAAWFAWASWMLTVPFFFQSFAVYPDGLGATLVLWGATRLVDLNRTGETPPYDGGARRWLAVGVALALLPWLHTRFAIVAAALGAILVARLSASRHARRDLAALLAVPAVSAVAWFAYFRVIYGTFNPAAPYGGATQSSVANIATGLPALFLDQQFGILPNAPVYGFSVVALFAMAREHRRLALELLVVVVAYLLSASAFYMWWGGSAAPARFAVPVLPLLILPTAWLWGRPLSGATRTLAFVLLAASISITATMATVDGGRLAYNFRDGVSLFAEWLSPLVDLPRGLPSFLRQSSLGATARAAVWIVAILVAWLAVLAIERRRERSCGALALAVLTSLAIAVMAALTVVWKIDSVAALSPETSQLSLLEHFDPEVRPVGVVLSPLKLDAPQHTLAMLHISSPARRPSSNEVLLLVPGIVPAGKYAVEVTGSQLSGNARLVIGRGAPAVESWNLRTDVHDGRLLFDLPVDVGSIVIISDPDARVSVSSASLRPLEIVPPSRRLSARYARRAQRYGPGVVFFLDDGVFAEEPGFWVRGNMTASFVVSSRVAGSRQLFLRNSPEANDVTITIDGRDERLSLQPREERVVPLTLRTPDGVALVSLRSPAGFHPSDLEPGSTDTRFLGVWVELR